MCLALKYSSSLSLTPSLTCQSVSASDLRVLISDALASQDTFLTLSGPLRICSHSGLEIGVVAFGSLRVAHLKIFSETGLDGSDSDTTAWRLP